MDKKELKKLKKAPANMRGTHADDFIQAFGNSRIQLAFYRVMFFALIVVTLVLSIVVVTLTAKVNEEKPLPIFIDRISGSARPVDFNVIDAEGSVRHQSEIEDFLRDYLNNLYTYNQYTVRKNLNYALSLTATGAHDSIKEYLKMTELAANVGRGMQGMVEIKSIVILKALPELKVQVYFVKKVVSDIETVSSEHIAVVELRTVIRRRNNSHGLMVVEYRESEYKKEGTIDG